MNIGYIGNIPEPVGGAEVFLREFLDAFLRKGRNRAVLARWRKQIFMYFPEIVAREYAPVGTVKKYRGLTVYYIFEAISRCRYERKHKFQARLINQFTHHAEEVARVFSRHRVSLVHTHMLFPNVYIGAVAADLLGVPHVATIHGMLEFHILDYNKKRFPIFADLVRRKLTEADSVVAVSSEITRECRRRGVKRVVKIPPFVDTDFFTPGNSRPGKDILFLGSIRRDKGAHLLISAFNRIVRDIDIKGDLLLIGNNLLDKEALRGAENNPRIRFLGVQDKRFIRSAIRRARLVVLPSISEGLPVSILEAMACASPVLVTPVGELRSVIKDNRNGFFLYKRTVGGIARKLKELLGGKLDLSLVGERARETALCFGIQANITAHERLYRRLA